MKTILTLLTILVFSTAVFAHDGPRVWIDTVNGGVITLTSDNDIDPTIYTPSRLFTGEFNIFFGIYTTDFPGYEIRREGASVADGTTFGFNITGPLLYFDDATDTFVTVQQEFGPPQTGSVPQIALSLGQTIRVSGGGLVSGFDFYTFNEPGDHAHLSYTFLGDGSTASNGPSGVYAIPLNLTSAGLTTSDTFYLLIGKDVAQTDPLFLSAIDVAQTTLVGAAISGDMNGDGVVNNADVEPFVEVLLGLDSDTNHLAAADVNGDESANGADIGPFMEALLAN